MIDALRMQVEDLEREISEYEDLKEGCLLSLGADDLDSLGELVTKARIACAPCPAAGGAPRAGRVAEDRPVAPGRGRRRFGVRYEHQC